MAAEIAVARVIKSGADDVFRRPTFSDSIESEIIRKREDLFRDEARQRTVSFLEAADLRKERVGPARKGLVSKDEYCFRQCVWLDPFDAVKYLAAACLLFEKIEAARIPKDDKVIHSHRRSSVAGELFDAAYGYKSFRERSAELSNRNVGKWKVVTDISNFFDRISNHSLENHLLNIGCDRRYVTLVREMLFFWAGDRRSFGVPVGSDGSRILSEAILLSVDKGLRSRGIEFTRYVDDFRIFSDTRAEAIKSVELLTALLADEGCR